MGWIQGMIGHLVVILGYPILLYEAVLDVHQSLNIVWTSNEFTLQRSLNTYIIGLLVVVAFKIVKDRRSHQEVSEGDNDEGKGSDLQNVKMVRLGLQNY